MGAGVVLDTSFLITLAGPERQHHSAARRYWQHFMEQQVPVFLPTIVVSEFCVRQEIPPDILRSCVVLPFNWDDAILAAQLDFKRFKEPNESRVAVKDDIKILAQASICGAEHVISEDRDTMVRMALELREAGKVTFRAICLSDGFDRSFLDPSGQRDFDDAIAGADSDSV